MNFLYPTTGEYRKVTQTFAEHVARRKANGWPPGSYNGGIDWGLPEGKMIRAGQDGVVTVARNDHPRGYGMHVRIQHQDGFLSIYGHLSRLDVAVGQAVTAGQQIGLSGNTGNSTGPHLHFEVRYGGIEWNPEQYLVEELLDGNAFDLQIPVLPRAEVLVAKLLVRAGPGTSYVRIGSLIRGERVRVIGWRRFDAQNIWLEIGYQQWCAMLYRGEVMATVE